ncbi:MAG: putative O-glycosylation ligase, exosortase A system-associated [Proteobacteria bacterium]|nr:putative O-glycosylation ligase, exosortase A system-associated [Pseudomonadota bacterium]
MRGVFLLGVISLVILWGFRAPILFVLGYVWASIFTPQRVAYSIVTSIPISLIFALFSFAAFFLLKKENYIRWRTQSIMSGLLAVWMTVSLLWAVVPESAYIKWDWAVKSIVFTVIIPHFIRGKKEFEAFLWTILIPGMAHCIAFGAKVFLSGGGYGIPLGLVGGNTGYGEGSTLAMFSVSLIPVAAYLFFHQTLLPQKNMTRWMLGSFIVLLLLAGIGTYARTAAVCLVVLVVCLIYYSKRKLLGVLSILLFAAVVYPFIDVSWIERMATIDSGSDASAMGRVAVWKWVIEYIAIHPLGGSFDMYRINSYTMDLSDGSILHVTAKAFHSIYFEVLGEGGIPGILIFIVLILTTLAAFMRHREILTTTGEAWLSDAGRYLLMSTLVYLAGGAFIGIAFQSYFYYLAALSAAYINLGVKYART